MPGPDYEVVDFEEPHHGGYLIDRMPSVCVHLNHGLVAISKGVREPASVCRAQPILGVTAEQLNAIPVRRMSPDAVSGSVGTVVVDDQDVDVTVRSQRVERDESFEGRGDSLGFVVRGEDDHAGHALTVGPVP
jgi:hypothetical protein